MIQTHSLFIALEDYRDWSMAKLFAMCEGLSDDSLDATKEMGFGSLRSTLFHMFVAEQVWMDRLTSRPWIPFPTNPNGISVEKIKAGFESIGNERRELIVMEADSRWQRVVEYRDSRGNAYQNELGDLLIHVVNHRVYHQSQALRFLKAYDRKLAGGLDYVFYKLAYPTISQSCEAKKALREYGLEVEVGEGALVAWDPTRIERMFAYDRWAMEKVLMNLNEASNETLDRDFGIGVGGIRKSILHVLDAMRFWARNLVDGPAAWDQSPADLPMDLIRKTFLVVNESLVDWIRSDGDRRVDDPIAVSFGGPPVSLRLYDALVTLIFHGTHHRAQIINMMRRSDLALPTCDFVVFARERQSRDWE